MNKISDLSEEEQLQIEMDLEEGNYRQWVDKYPSMIYAIFGQYLDIAYDSPVTKQDIRYFQDKGIDLDQESSAYRVDAGSSNALQMACEWRRLDWMKMFLELKADVNLVLGDTYSPLDSAVLGHGALWVYEYSQIQDCIELLTQYGAKRELGQETAEEVLPYMLAKEAGPFLNAYFKDIPIRPKKKGPAEI